MEPEPKAKTVRIPRKKAAATSPQAAATIADPNVINATAATPAKIPRKKAAAAAAASTVNVVVETKPVRAPRKKAAVAASAVAATTSAVVATQTTTPSDEIADGSSVSGEVYVNIQTKYSSVSMQEHARKKEMWAGSHEFIETDEFTIIDGKIIKKRVSYPQSLYKSFDEACVNVLDQYIKTAGQRNRVKEMRCDISPDGAYSVMNDGPGIEIELYRDGIYLAQFLFGVPYSGENIEKNADSITGGTNGLGIKLANMFSLWLILETVRKGIDANGNSYHKKYIQKWTDGMKNVLPPVITDTKEKEYTRVTFMPDYKNLYKCTFEDTKDIIGVIHNRLYLAAAYAKIDIYFNGVAVPVKKLEDYAYIFAGGHIDTVVSQQATATNTTEVGKGKDEVSNENQVLPPILNTVIKGQEAPYPWGMSIVCAHNDAKSRKEPSQISIVNGVIVQNGKHVDYVLDKIIEGVKEKIEKGLKGSNIQFKPEYVYNNITIILNCKIPGVQWDSQTKTKLAGLVKGRKFTVWNLDTKFINALATQLEDTINLSLFQEKPAAKTKKAPVNFDKYMPAGDAGGPNSALCGLFLPEGDSAATMCANGIDLYDDTDSSGKNEPIKTGRGKKMTKNTSGLQYILGHDRYGYLTLGGVIINVRKRVREVNVGGTIKYVMTKSGKAGKSPDKSKAKEDFWDRFLAVTGLNQNYKYDPKSPTYTKEMSELRYGQIIIFVDQDHDGLGQICGLILNIFALFWPNLFTQGFVKRLATPLRRAYPKSGGTILEFFTDTEYEDWLQTIIKHGDSADNYDIKYIKGLATHSEAEVKNIFRNFHKNLFTYTTLPDYNKYFEIYFGKDPDLRKVELFKPYVNMDKGISEQQRKTMTITTTDHLNYETKLHKLMNLDQKLWSALDGMNESGRKILCASLAKFAKSNKPIRVATLGGYTVEKTNYHHGEASLNNSIIIKAFVTCGGVNLPHLLPASDAFGSRKGGTADAGQPRYINTMLNRRLMSILCPQVDLPLLKYNFDEGKRGEPTAYANMILPMAILESIEMPADGWKIKVWARDIFVVIDAVRKLILAADTAGSITHVPNTALPNIEDAVSTTWWTGSLRYVNNKLYGRGALTYDAKSNNVHITELPLREWHEPYFERIKKQKHHVDVGYSTNYGSGSTVNINFKLLPGSYDEITKNGGDPIEALIKYFEVESLMDSHLNMIGANGEVVEFKNYTDVLRYWFPYRRELYKLRIDREVMICKLFIRMLKSIIRYVTEGHKVKGMTKLRAVEYLRSCNFEPCNAALLRNPKFIPTEQLENAIFSDSAYADDDSDDDSDGDNDRSNVKNIHTSSADNKYNYLLNITDLMRLDEAIKKREEDVKKYENRIKELTNTGHFPGANIWLSELIEIENVIKTGIDTKWKFGEDAKYKF